MRLGRSPHGPTTDDGDDNASKGSHGGGRWGLGRRIKPTNRNSSSSEARKTLDEDGSVSSAGTVGQARKALLNGRLGRRGDKRKTRTDNAESPLKQPAAHTKKPTRGVAVAKPSPREIQVVPQKPKGAEPNSTKHSDKAQPSTSQPPTSAPQAKNNVQEEPARTSKRRVKAIVFVLEPRSQTFEFLLMELHRKSSKVEAVVAHIQKSSTRDALRSQAYIGICARDGALIYPHDGIPDDIDDREILLAIPDGYTAHKMVRDARRIIRKERILTSLESRKVLVEPWLRKLSDDEASVASVASSHSHASSNSFASLQSIASSHHHESRGKKVQDAAPTNSNTGSFFGVDENTIIVGVVALGVVFAWLLNIFQPFCASPIKPDRIIPPRLWLSKCGLRGYFGLCENQFLILDDKGTVSSFNGRRELQWVMQGETCPPYKLDCIPGLQMDKTGTIWVSGSPVKQVIMFKDDVSLAPWPFADVPNVALVRPGHLSAGNQGQLN